MHQCYKYNENENVHVARIEGQHVNLDSQAAA
jgi:hypothetical protein